MKRLTAITSCYKTATLRLQKLKIPNIFPQRVASRRSLKPLDSEYSERCCTWTTEQRPVNSGRLVGSANNMAEPVPLKIYNLDGEETDNTHS